MNPHEGCPTKNGRTCRGFETTRTQDYENLSQGRPCPKTRIRQFQSGTQLLWARANYPIPYSNACLRGNTIFQMTCCKWKELLIGSTIQSTHNRIKKHLNDAKSSLKKHIVTCRTTVNNSSIHIRTLIQGNVMLIYDLSLFAVKNVLNSKTIYFSHLIVLVHCFLYLNTYFLALSIGFLLSHKPQVPSPIVYYLSLISINCIIPSLLPVV